MLQKHFLIYLLFLCIIVFSIYSVNPSLMGADTWFYVNQVCDKSTIDFRDPLFSLILFVLPCDFIAIKLYLFVLFATSIFVFAKIGELYFQKEGQILGAIFGFLTLVLVEFMVFENDSLGYTIFFIALYFSLRYYKTSKKERRITDAIISLSCLFIAAFAWKGVIYWSIVLILFNPFVILILVPGLILYCGDLFWFVNAQGGLIMEQTPFVALIYYGVTIFFLYGLIKTPKKEALAFILMCIPGIFVQKLFILAIPFISIVTLYAFVMLKKYKDTLLPILLVFCVLMAAFWGIHSFSEFPTTDDLNVVMTTKELTNKVQNTFGAGYLLEFYDINVSSKGQTTGNDYNCVGYVIEHPQIADCNCNVVMKSTNLLLETC